MNSLYMTKEGEQSPDIIYTQTFHVAQAKYLGYTERKEAINPEKDFELENNPYADKIQKDPDEKFAGYIGYTDRQAATKLERGVDKNRYPTFTKDSLNIDNHQHQELIDNLNLAQKNKTMLWAGVISFSPEFIREAGLYDEKNKTVDQRAIKLAVQKAMPGFLAQEELNNSETFWWGDVHLNTDHVHVHLAISQRQNTRELLKNGEPVGMFHTKSLRRLKSDVHNELARSINRERDVELDKEIDHLRKDLVENVQWLVRHDADQQQQLQNIYWSLPQYRDKRKWRASNHSKVFHESHELTEKLVDNFLNDQLHESYQQFKAAVHEKDTRSRKKYGQHIKDTEKKRDKALREFLANRVYDYLREVDEQQNGQQTLEKIAAQGVDENLKQIELEKQRLSMLKPSSNEAKALKKRLGLRRLYLRQVNLDARANAIDNQIAKLKRLHDKSPANEYFLNVLKEQRELVTLKKLPKFERTKQGLTKRYRELSKRYVNVVKLPIQAASPEVVSERIDQLGKELGVMLKYSDSPTVQMMLPNSSSPYGLQNAVYYYQMQQQVLKLKGQIYENNRQYKDDFAKRNAMNRPLFQRLKKSYAMLDNGEKLDQMIQHRQEFLERTQKQAQERYQTHRGSLRLLSNLDRLMSGLQRDGRAEMNAMRKHLDDDDGIERADREEERETREI